MRALLNATTLHSGGGLQAGVSLVAESLRRPAGVAWRYAVSPHLGDELSRLGLALPAGSLVTPSPARDRAARRAVADFAARRPCDAVFTVFGPAYVRFESPHVMGVADGWTTHAGRLAYRSLAGPVAAAATFARCVYKGLWYRHADHWIVEAECARLGLRRRLGVPSDRVSVIPNTCAAAYRRADEARPTPGPDDPIRVLTFAHPYPHKDLRILPEVAAALRETRPDRQFRFVTSVPPEHPQWDALRRRAEALGVADALTTVGRVTVAGGVDLYRGADVCLMPTLLETFSAAYPEAMAMGLPIVTTDLGFARDVCGDAALYYRPRDAADAARRLAELADSPRLWTAMVRRGKRRLDQSPDAADRYDRVVETLLRVAHRRAAVSTRRAA